MTSRSELVLTGLAQLLADAGVAAYRPTGDYVDGEVPITFEELSPAGPAVALTLYAEEAVDVSSIRFYVQARIRGTDDPLDLQLTDGVRDALAWRRHPPMPDGIDVVQIVPGPVARLGKLAGAYHTTRNFSLWI